MPAKAQDLDVSHREARWSFSRRVGIENGETRGVAFYLVTRATFVSALWKTAEPIKLHENSVIW